MKRPSPTWAVTVNGAWQAEFSNPGAAKAWRQAHFPVSGKVEIVERKPKKGVKP